MYGSYIFDIHTIFLNPYLFLQPLKLATSNLVHNLGSTSSMPKTTFTTKFGGVWSWEASEKKLGLPNYFCSCWSYWLQIWYTTWVRRIACQKQLSGLKLTLMWAREHPQIYGVLCNSHRTIFGRKSSFVSYSRNPSCIPNSKSWL